MHSTQIDIVRNKPLRKGDATMKIEKLKRFRVFVFLFLFVGFFCSSAQALTVSGDPLIGSFGFGSTATVTDTFSISTAGSYILHFDYFTNNFPGGANDLTLQLFMEPGTDPAIISTSEQGAYTFVADVGSYFIEIFGTAGHSFESAFFAAAVTPVPLPAALVLFGSALTILWSIAFRRRAQKSINTSEGTLVAA